MGWGAFSAGFIYLFGCATSELCHTGSSVFTAAHEIQFPDQGSQPGPLYWEYRVLATRPPELLKRLLDPVSFLKDLLAGKKLGFLGQFFTLLMFFILSQKDFQSFKSLVLILSSEVNNNQAPLWNRSY